MGAFIEETATEVIDLDREFCNPKPDGSAYHDHDTVTVRTEYGYGDILAINKAGAATPSLLWDGEMATLMLLAKAIVAWSFVDGDGKPIPIGLPMIRRLDPKVGEQVAVAADRHFQAAQASLPNLSGAPSPPSSPARSSALGKRRRTGKRSTPRSN